MTGDLVEVWLIRADQPDPVVSCLEALLDDTERQRAGDLRLAEHRRRFVTAHGAMRVIIGRRLGLPPAQLGWRHGPHGKPELASPPGALRFSLSHSGELAALALCVQRAVGVDIQQVPAGLDPVAMSGRYYPPLEASFVAAADRPQRQLARFLRLWTRKEACLKVAGDRLIPGLKLPVRGSGTGSGSSGPIIVADPGGPLPGPYLVTDVQAPPGFYASVAIAGAEPYRVRKRWWSADRPGG